MKIRDKLERLRKLAPSRSPLGQLYKSSKELKKAYARVSMWTILVSSENTRQVHEAVFTKEAGKTAPQWAEWFTKNFEIVYVKGVLAGVGIRTEKQWSVQQIIGWVGHAEYAVSYPKVGSKRNKAKRQGRKNGQVRVRRRRRNKKR